MINEVLYFEYTKIFNSTSKSVEVFLTDVNRFMWFPKSQCNFLRGGSQEKNYVAVPEWLAKKMEIEKKAADFNG